MSNEHSLPNAGFVRLRHVLAPTGPIPVSKSTWWAGVKSGRFPKPRKIGKRITAWRVEDIRELIYGKRKHKNKYRILYAIRQDVVAILYIHHSARDEIEP